MSGPTSTKIRSEVNALLARSRVYRFIARCFRRPVMGIAAPGEGNTDLPVREILDSLPFKNREDLAGRLTGLSENLRQATCGELVSEYEDLFGYTASGPVPCYELEYGEEHTHREPQQLSDIASFYHAFGLQAKQGNFERVDHIATECEFMHFLLFKEAYALSDASVENAEICHRASIRFLQAHLGRWAPSFSLKLSRHARHGFYKDLADLAFSYIVQDCEWLGVTAGPEDLPIRPVREKEDSGCVSCSLRPATPQ